MANVFSGNSANEVWQKGAIALSSCTSMKDSRLGPAKELLHVYYEILSPSQRWVYSRKPAINPAFALAEVIWILNGRNDASYINFWNPALTKYAGNSKNYHGAYGYRICKHFGFNQLEKAYQTLKSNPNSRQVVIQLWDPKIDFPYKNGKPRSTDIPCNISSILKIRDGKLEWLQVMRSNDHFRGTPYNFVQFTSLQEIMAGWLNCSLGTYCQISDSAHIYEKDFQEFSIETRPPDIRNTDSLRLSKNIFSKILPKLMDISESLTDRNLKIKTFRDLLSNVNLPASYSNWAYILGADSARRHGWHDEMKWASEKCSNKVLRVIWDNWANRWSDNQLVD
jgi:thymidylate synthase